jgi:chaperone required for assembly of F1-ATPase
VAEEWRAQEEQFRPETMILTKLANTAIDRVRPNRRPAIEQVLGFGRSDLLCYRAEAPEALVHRQAAAWDPLLEWARERHGVGLVCGAGIAFIEQPPETLAALERAIAGHDDFALAALHAAATLLGSAIVALALSAGHLTADQAFAAAQLDEIFQAEKWGIDHEAATRSQRKAAELADIARFFALVRR